MEGQAQIADSHLSGNQMEKQGDPSWVTRLYPSSQRFFTPISNSQHVNYLLSRPSFVVIRLSFFCSRSHLHTHHFNFFYVHVCNDFFKFMRKYQFQLFRKSLSKLNLNSAPLSFAIQHPFCIPLCPYIFVCLLLISRLIICISHKLLIFRMR